MKRSTQTLYQYEPLITPESWEGEERRFSIRLSLILDKLHQRIGQMPSRMHPVGSIYLSALDTDPARFFGGVWEKIDFSAVPEAHAWKRTA